MSIDFNLGLFDGDELLELDGGGWDIRADATIQLTGVEWPEGIWAGRGDDMTCQLRNIDVRVRD